MAYAVSADGGRKGSKDGHITVSDHSFILQIRIEHLITCAGPLGYGYKSSDYKPRRSFLIQLGLLSLCQGCHLHNGPLES